MRILMIRHGDPDYENDTLTEKGKKEAKLLSERIIKLKDADFYQSPLGRAQDTAGYTLKRLGKTAPTLEWLQEFPAKLDINPSPALQKAFPDTRLENGIYRERIVWDATPIYWTEHPEYFDATAWRTSEIAAHSDLNEKYALMSSGLDSLLEHYGYYREGNYYRTASGRTDTVVMFCHFGVTCAMLSYLWNVSPFILWHSLAAAPTSVTELYSEEREKGIAYFRAACIGDISHLYAANEPPSFSARFCETFEKSEERH